MALAKLCPTCHGCGRTSLDQFGREVAQLLHITNNTSAADWTKCSSCGGVGVVALIDRFANGLSVDEYLQTRLGDM